MAENPASGPDAQPQPDDGWQALLQDMSSTAEAYRDRGWTVLELHPGDAALVDSDRRTGLDVVLPGPEYEQLEPLAADTEFTEVDVFRAEADGLCYLLVVEKAPDDETAVLVPAYYDPGGSEPKVETIRSDGEIRLFCRRLNDDYVEFVHTTVEPFLPEGLADV